jgi:outer membrane protein assembly factor BamB
VTYDGDAARSGVAFDGPSPSRGVRVLWASPTLDGDVYAQPLVVGARVVIATENDTVYSLRARDGAIVWRRHLGEPVSNASLPCGDVDPVGITSTPVIDVQTNRVYVVGMVQPHEHVLFALDALTGRVVTSLPVDATGADARVQNQRGALSLSHGTILVPYGGRYGDCGDYHGRLVSVTVTANALKGVGSYTLPTERQGGFWAPPGPVIANDGSVFLASGNSASSGAYDYGNSVVHLTSSSRLVDSWAPTNWASLNATDTDIGSTSPVLLPGNRIFQIGKQGTGYLLDATHLGGIGGELHAADVCRGAAAFGAVAHDHDTLFVPCINGVAQITVTHNTFATGWTTPLAVPGPTVVADGAMWTITTRDGDLVALDESTGHVLFTRRVGDVPSRFTSPAIGDNQVIVAAQRTVSAYGN